MKQIIGQAILSVLIVIGMIAIVFDLYSMNAKLSKLSQSEKAPFCECESSVEGISRVPGGILLKATDNEYSADDVILQCHRASLICQTASDYLLSKKRKLLDQLSVTK